MAHPNLPLGQQGILLRALSVVDIALWDLKGKAAGLPLYRLMGGHRQRVPVQVAGGYYGTAKSVDDLADEIRRYADAGFSMVKIVVGNATLEEDNDPQAEIDVFHKLQRRQPVIEAGHARVSEEPGLGLEIDWGAVERYAVERCAV